MLSKLILNSNNLSTVYWLKLSISIQYFLLSVKYKYNSFNQSQSKTLSKSFAILYFSSGVLKNLLNSDSSK